MILCYTIFLRGMFPYKMSEQYKENRKNGTSKS